MLLSRTANPAKRKFRSKADDLDKIAGISTKIGL